MTVDPGSNSAQQGPVGTAQSAPVVPAQQGPVEPSQQGPVEAEATPEVTGHLAGDPLSLGLPSFIIGSVALGMVLVGFVSPLGTGASLPIILAATAAGLFISTFWAIAVGQSAVGMVLGVFAGFWLSYAFFVLGLTHNWFGVGAADVKASTELFLTAWVVIFSMLTLATLRLAFAFTAVIGLVDVAVILVLIGVIQVEPNLLKAGGATAFLFAAVGIYIFFGTASIATGGKAMPLGRPVLKA
ncbi:MAG TPA: GPR1/FUN34/YaaH family transporter [Streptosporangiaceae bacterium]|jgi:succinate-acetate transporter protein|nr:GPR1/FUN34/YaaH family transporter [Streptosporangiaceae bacterium]